MLLMQIPTNIFPISWLMPSPQQNKCFDAMEPVDWHQNESVIKLNSATIKSTCSDQKPVLS